jgi:hypothetical protein
LFNWSIDVTGIIIGIANEIAAVKAALLKSLY